MTYKVHVGIIGLGYWGKNILRNMYTLGVVDTACDSDPHILQERKKEFPRIHYVAHFEELICNPAIQAVVIATPAVTHYELAKEALLRGKDVFVEKPLALRYSHGQELVELAKLKKRILMVGHVLQYHPGIVKLQELIAQGRLGKIEYIYSNRLNIGKLRVEENILWSFAPHDISAILSLVGREPVRVHSSGSSYLNEGIYDVTLTVLEFTHKIKAHIFVSWLHPFKEQKLIVVGSDAMAVFDDVSKEKLCLYPHKIEWREGKIPIACKAPHTVIPFEEKEPLHEEMKHFIECIVKRIKPRTDGYEGLRVLKVLEDAEQSLSGSVASKSISGEVNYAIHPSAVIDKEVRIGEGTQIWHFSHILIGSEIGKNTKIGQNVVIGPRVKVGDGCKIQNNVSIYEGVTLEEQVFCGPSCVFTNVINPRSAFPRMHEIQSTLVKKGATIGANATIICGNTIGKYSFIGAGSVVTKEVPDYALVYGNPATIKGWMCACGLPLVFNKSKAECKGCKKKYHKSKDKVEERERR